MKLTHDEAKAMVAIPGLEPSRSYLSVFMEYDAIREMLDAASPEDRVEFTSIDLQGNPIRIAVMAACVIGVFEISPAMTWSEPDDVEGAA